MFVDHHVHLFSDEAARTVSRALHRTIPPYTGAELVQAMHEGAVDRASVLSVAYMHRSAEDTAAENDWVAEECDGDPRLLPFFSVNPLAPYALDEVTRCLSNPRFKGLKLHFANSGVDLLNDDHRRCVNRLLKEVGQRALPTVIHLRSMQDWSTTHVDAFVADGAEAGGGAAIQFAHLGGWGGYDEATAETLAALVRAMERGLNAYVDVSAVNRQLDRTASARLAADLQKVPPERLLFGTDWPDWTARSYRESLLPLAPAGAFENAAPWIT